MTDETIPTFEPIEGEDEAPDPIPEGEDEGEDAVDEPEADDA